MGSLCAILSKLSVDNSVLVKSKRERDIALVLSTAQSLRDRIVTNEKKHLIAKTSDLGWCLVSNREGLEGQVGRICMVNLQTQ